MARRIAVIVVMLSSLYYTSNSSAQMSQEEEVVRNAYAKLSFMCELGVVTDAAFDIKNNRIGSNIADLNTLVAEFCPVFSLSAFQIGPIADIADEPLSRFITLPTQHDQVIRVTRGR